MKNEGHRDEEEGEATVLNSKAEYEDSMLREIFLRLNLIPGSHDRIFSPFFLP